MQGFALASSPGADTVIGRDCTFDDSVRWGADVRLGDEVHVGAGVTLYDGARIGARSWVGPGCSIGEPTMEFYRQRDAYAPPATRLGADCILRRGTIVSAGAQIGARFQSGPYAAIRENVRIGESCSLGNNCDVQYDVEIGDFTRIHSNVAVGSGTRIGPFVWVHPFVVFTNDRVFPTFAAEEPPVVAPFCAIAVHSTILPGAQLGVHTIVGAHSKVGGKTPAFAFMDGSPAENRIDARRMIFPLEGTGFRPYPWIRHIDRDYPWASVPPEERRIEDWVPEEWRGYLESE